MIGFEDARALVREAAAPLPAETLPLQQASGRVSAMDVASPMPLPPFDNAAMDGFALRVADAAISAGTELAVHGEQAAGDGERTVHEGACAIMTGARLPGGTDAVLPVEQAETLLADDAGHALHIRLLQEVRQGLHVRRVGEDIDAGEVALRAGAVVDADAQMLLGSLGIATLQVHRRPRVAILVTGRELVADAGLALAPGQIRDSNGPYLAAMLQASGAEVIARETLPDAPEAFLDALGRAREAGADVVVSTGAVSMGRHDFIPAALAQAGAELLFHKVAMRPGKPILLARLPWGALHFGLPGNPVSCAVGQRFFVDAALRRMLGQPPEQPWRMPLAAPLRKKAGFTAIHKAALELHADGGLSVRSLPGQESFRIRPLLQARAWLVLPEARAALDAGEIVEVHPRLHRQQDWLQQVGA